MAPFLYDRKVVHTGLFLSYKKRSAWMHTRAKMKMSLMRPRSAREFRKRNSFLPYRIKGLSCGIGEERKYMVILREQQKQKKDIDEKLWNDDFWNLPKNSEFDIGIAVDIGTTTIAMTILSLPKRKVIGQISETNEQTKLGADVMMRIMHTLSGKGGILHEMVVAQIEQMAQKGLQDKIDFETFDSKKVHIAVVGNTTMCHLFLDKSVAGLAGFPFQAAYNGNFSCTGYEIGMKVLKSAKISVLSGIAAHVGSDALAVIGTENLMQKEKVQLAVDLGTNAEIILNQRGVLRVCSTAAGPAFEGKGIQCGMPAKSGAVSGVKISSGNGNIILEYIGDELPKGLCGSGLVDAIAEIQKCRVLLSDGYLLTGEEAKKQGVQREICRQLIKRNGQTAFLLYRGEKDGREIYLQQSDIRSVQLAKGAIQAGISALLQLGGISLSNVEEIIVSGVLGSCLRFGNAVKIGLLPDVSRQKVFFVGNAAGRGAARVITDKSFSKEMELLAQQIEHVELADLPEFQNLLLQAMDLESW